MSPSTSETLAARATQSNVFRGKLPQRPVIHGHLSYAHALLKAGELREGWEQYEFRWLEDPLLSLRPKFPRPPWQGQDLRGKTILLRSEQGAGDAIQFIRYAPLLKKMGATVLLTVLNGIDDLARWFPGVDQALDPKKPPPNFDYYVHMLSLPRLFGTDVNSIPADIPYLQVEDAKVKEWATTTTAVDRPASRTGVGRQPESSKRSISLDAITQASSTWRSPRCAFLFATERAARG